MNCYSFLIIQSLPFEIFLTFILLCVFLLFKIWFMLFKPTNENKCKGLYYSFQGYPKPTVSCPQNLCFPDFNVHRNHLRILWILIQWEVKFSISNKLPPDAHACALKNTLWGASLHCIETEDWCPTWPVKLFSCIPFIFNRHSSYKSLNLWAANNILHTYPTLTHAMCRKL